MPRDSYHLNDSGLYVPAVTITSENPTTLDALRNLKAEAQAHAETCAARGHLVNATEATALVKLLEGDIERLAPEREDRAEESPT